MTTTRRNPRLFQLGQLLATPGVLNLGVDLPALLARHASGDWGDLSDDDRDANERALHIGARILSAYTLPQGRVWIITEADRASTTALLPEEY
jgi:hypothetical protein